MIGLYLKIGLVALVLLGGAAFVWHYKHLQAEAAKVAGLEATIADANTEALRLNTRLAEVEAAKAAAETNLSNNLANKTAILKEVRNASKNTSVATNVVCFPSDTDRELRNNAIGRIVGLRAVGRPTPLSGPAAPID